MLSYFKELYKYLHPGHSDVGQGLAPISLQILMLDEIGKAMSSAMEGVDQTLDLICEAVTVILGVEKSVLLNLDIGHRRLVVQAARGMIDLNQVRARQIPVDTGVIGQCLQEKRPLIGDLSLERDRTLREFYQQLELQQFIAAPLSIGDRVLGVLLADSKLDQSPFNNADLKLINVLANLAAVTRENASLISDLRARNSRLNALLDISSVMSSTLDLKTLLDVILDRAIELTHANTGAILIVEEDSPVLAVKSARGFSSAAIQDLTLRPGQGLTGWALLENRSIRVPNVALDPRYIKVSDEIRSELAVPIRQKERVVGVINVDSFSLDAFTELDQQLLEILAAQAAVAIRNASMFTELRHQIEDV